MKLVYCVLEEVIFLLEEKVSVYYLPLFVHDIFGKTKDLFLGLSSFLDNLIVFFIHDLFVAFAYFQLIYFFTQLSIRITQTLEIFY